MILVDTSVWIHHFRYGDPKLQKFLYDEAVATHPMVIGELACGSLKNRTEVLGLLENLPFSPVATHDEVMQTIEKRALIGRGVGYVDTHLLTSVLINPFYMLWTSDRRLHSVAEELGVGWCP